MFSHGNRKSTQRKKEMEWASPPVWAEQPHLKAQKGVNMKEDNRDGVPATRPGSSTMLQNSTQLCRQMRTSG